jgi:hypothetical protein
MKQGPLRFFTYTMQLIRTIAALLLAAGVSEVKDIPLPIHLPIHPLPTLLAV